MISTEQSLSYSHSLILSSAKKTCEALGRHNGQSGDKMLRIIKTAGIDIEKLIFVAHKLFRGKRIYLVIDDTLLSKEFSSIIEGTSDNFDSSTRSTYRSLCSVVLMLTDGKSAIPITHEFWTSKEFLNDGTYATKIEIAKKLIKRVLDLTKIDLVIMDGLYASSELIEWMISLDIYFEMRFHANRKILPEGEKAEFKIKEYFDYIRPRKMRYHTIKGTWKGLSLYFTAVKRTTKKGTIIIIYQVSNYKTKPKNHARIYGFRWNIEKFFRTGKQSLGLNDCQSRSKRAQHNHITHVFLAYSILQLLCREKKLKTPEAASRYLKSKENSSIQFLESFTAQHFGAAYA